MRVVAVVLGLVVLVTPPCWAHGHPSSLGISSEHEPSFSAPSVQRPSREWQNDTHDSKNPYEDMSCPELYVLATQAGQSADLAQAFKDKDCHAL